jgi:hypothetical protein
MKLPQDALIAPEKITHYLLIRQNRSDKSAFLEKGGFSLLDPGALISSLAALREANDAQLVDDNKFGRYYEIIGDLIGPNGIGLRVRTIWMTEHLSGLTKFITLIPIAILSQ